MSTPILGSGIVSQTVLIQCPSSVSMSISSPIMVELFVHFLVIQSFVHYLLFEQYLGMQRLVNIGQLLLIVSPGKTLRQSEIAFTVGRYT